jgi:hypothetical protein
MDFMGLARCGNFPFDGLVQGVKLTFFAGRFYDYDFPFGLLPMTGLGFIVILPPLCIISSSFFMVCSFPRHVSLVK